MIDGKLTEEGKDAPNIQVVLPSVDPNCEFSLEDEGRSSSLSLHRYGTQRRTMSKGNQGVSSQHRIRA